MRSVNAQGSGAQRSGVGAGKWGQREREMGAFYFVGLRSNIGIDCRVGAKGAAMLRPYNGEIAGWGGGRRGDDACVELLICGRLAGLPCTLFV